MLRPTLGFAIVLAAALLVNSIRLPQRAYAVDLPEGYNEKSESRSQVRSITYERSLQT